MADALVSGARIAARCWWAGLTLFLANLVFGLFFTAASWHWLSGALGASLATRTLLTHLDMNVFVDLFIHHGESLRMLAVGGAMITLVRALAESAHPKARTRYQYVVLVVSPVSPYVVTLDTTVTICVQMPGLPPLSKARSILNPASVEELSIQDKLT